MILYPRLRKVRLFACKSAKTVIYYKKTAKRRGMVVKRIIVIGCPGSGKSRFARALHAETGIPLIHLDMLYWNADKTTVEKSLFLERLSEALDGETWIIDGNYISTMERRLSACDTVFFFDYPTELCLRGVRERRGVARTDMPWIETEDDAEFIEYVKAFNESQRPEIISLLERCSDKSITVFKSREQTDAYLGENMDNCK